MNYKLSKEIYGTPWFVDPITFIQLSKTLESFQNGYKEDGSKVEKANQFGILQSTELVFSARKIARMENVPPGSIAMYNFDSVITKYGGYSHYGTVEIANQFKEMENNENVIGHLFFIESGGGAANAIKYLREVSAVTERRKPLVSYIEDIGASAAMYIASDSDYIFVKSKDAKVGSIGTMMQLEGYKNQSENGDGKRIIRITATQSFNKNKEFEDAINEFNFELIRSKILDPLNNQFIADMEVNRPNITQEQKTGSIYNAGEVVGTLVDEIGSFDQAVNKVRELSKVNNNQIFNTMNAAELKAKHPEVYAEVFKSGQSSGTKAEKDRVNAWLVFNDLAQDKVKAGIESGESMTKAEELEFLRESQKASLRQGLENGSAPDFTPDKKIGKLKTEETEQAEKENMATNAAFDELGIPETKEG